MAVNPYRQLPIYEEDAVRWYRGQSRSDRPPHIFSVADAAYQALLSTRRSQSILVTGESGAGKTENTKCVIHYLTSISSSTSANDDLERQLILSNPILEAFGNAQTVRNNNSSRFGKFIRIDVDPNVGCITGASIETYLLEKSRITHRNLAERSFHVFYQLLAGADALFLGGTLLLPSACPEDYAYLAGSSIKVAGVDDAAEFATLRERLQIVGIDAAEQEAIFKHLATILLLGNLKVEDDPNNPNQATIPDSQNDLLKRICTLLGVPIDEFRSALLNPVIRAGREVVSQARDRDQVLRSIEALSRSLYERLFSQLVDRLNALLFRGKNISQSASSKSTFIGVLDIAGFEIFAQNGFEQLLINYTNEKLQQFFNHHMFIVEQEEYSRQGIKWDFVDFGLDSKPMIDLLEKGGSMGTGILACLDEDCLMPKATDKSFTSKVQSLCAGQAKFEVERLKADSGFTLNHYAGRVEYSTQGWLEKNKDPLNESVCRLFSAHGTAEIAALFADYAANTQNQVRGKAGIFRTVAQKHKESLTLLMTQLQATQPHFVRCILPNGDKQPGLLHEALVLEQLKCNGVLEGIRICRQGYPNRLSYPDFFRLYSILQPVSIAAIAKPTDIPAFLNDLMGWSGEQDYALGCDKIFFRAGRLGHLDALRDARLAEALRHLQAACRGALVREERDRAAKQAEAIKLLQSQLRPFVAIRRGPWCRLIGRVRPLLTVTRSENRIRQLQAQLHQAQKEHETQAAALKSSLEQERQTLSEWQSKYTESELNRAKIQSQVQEREVLISQLQARIGELQQSVDNGSAKISGLEMELKNLTAQVGEAGAVTAHLQAEIKAFQSANAGLVEEVEETQKMILKLRAEQAAVERTHEAAITSIESEKRQLQASLASAQESLQAAEEALFEANARADQVAIEFKSQLRAQQSQQERLQSEAQEQLEGVKRRAARETEALKAEIEAERKNVATLKEAIKAYESDTSQVEAERARNTQAFRRERERLEAKGRELARQRDEALEREEALQKNLSAAHEQARQARLALSQAEDLHAEQAQLLRASEAKLSALQDQSKTQAGEITQLKSQLRALQEELEVSQGAAEEAQDSLICAKDGLKAAEEVKLLLSGQLDAMKASLAKVQAERDALQAELAAQPRRPRSLNDEPTTLEEVIARIEADSQERQQLLRESRRLDRELRDALDALRDREGELLQAQESTAKADLRARKLATALEEAEAAAVASERTKRRLEADLIEERERADRLQRDVERMRLQHRQQAEALENAAALGHNRTMSCSSINSRMTANNDE